MGDWNRVALGKLAEISYGFTAKANHDTGPVKFLRITDIQDGGVNWSTVPYCRLPDKKLEKYILKPKDIVFARTGATTGKSFLLDNPPYAVFASYLIKATITSNELLPEFLYLYFQSAEYWSIISEGTSGSAQGGFNATKLKQLQIPLPPLPEQRRLVARLDAAFGELAQARALVERNLAAVEELWESRLGEVFGVNSQIMEKKQLGSLGTLTSSKRIFKKDYVGNGVPFYRSKEIKELAHSKPVSLKYFITHEKYSEIKSKYDVPSPGDILLTAVGTIGEMYIVKDSDEAFYFKDGNIMWLKNFSSVNSHYLKYALTFYVDQLNALSQGSAYKALTIEKLKKYSIPIASVQQQRNIVRDLDNFRSHTTALRAHYCAQLTALTDLKQSLLARAFAGEL